MGGCNHTQKKILEKNVGNKNIAKIFASKEIGSIVRKSSLFHPYLDSST